MKVKHDSENLVIHLELIDIFTRDSMNNKEEFQLLAQIEVPPNNNNRASNYVLI